MKKPNITEGEWFQFGAHVAASEYQTKIADCVSFQATDEECLANTKAISAVPDMIDTLISARAHISLNGVLDDEEMLRKIEQALEKAGCK